MKLCPECSHLNPPHARRCECGCAFSPERDAPPESARGVDRMLLGTAASVAFGVIALPLLVTAWGAITGQIHDPTELLFLPMVIFPALVYVGPVWLLLLVPLYFLVPPRSILWRWPVCTAGGALAGAGLAALLVSFPIAGAVIGGATCLFGSLTRPYFHRDHGHPRRA